jgi:DNA modification methylase
LQLRIFIAMTLIPNLVVQSDALFLLERLPSEYADLVYLDPPWNVGGLVFSSSVADEYYSFIFKVFQQVHRVLKETGNLFFYSHPDFDMELKLSLRGIFGGNHLQSEFIIPKRGVGTFGFQIQHDSLILYRKTDKSYFNGKARKLSDEEKTTYYPFVDDKGRYRTVSLFMQKSYSRGSYEWNGITPTEGSAWRFSIERMQQLEQEGLIAVAKGSSKESYRLKQYLNPEDEYRQIDTIWDDMQMPRTEKRYGGSQSVEFFDRLLNIGTNADDLVVDPFCGSGSLAVAAVNAKRKFIACDQDKNAVHVTVERLNEIAKTTTFLSEEDIQNVPLIWNHYKPYEYSDENVLMELIIKGESATVEFKESAKWNQYTKQPDENTTMSVMKAVAAFLNSPFGGTILIGINDDRKPVGLEKDFECADKKRKNQDGYSLFLNSKIMTLFGARVIGQYHLRFYNINSLDICRIDITTGREPFFLDGKYIVRNNNQSLELTTEEFFNRFKAEMK